MLKSKFSVAAVSALMGAAVVLSIQACSQSGHSADDGHGHAPKEQTTAAATSPSAKLHEIMMRPMHDMTMSGDVDKDFAALMIPHHQGAIDMAKIELEHGKKDELKKMARDIIASQSKEIEILKKHAGAAK